ncbi:hypothetical protein [Microbulbifer hainanensis]|nr:hypothetical protein [Microbulbifer hainanensis]
MWKRTGLLLFVAVLVASCSGGVCTERNGKPPSLPFAHARA